MGDLLRKVVITRRKGVETIRKIMILPLKRSVVIKTERNKDNNMATTSPTPAVT